MKTPFRALSVASVSAVALLSIAVASPAQAVIIDQFISQQSVSVDALPIATNFSSLAAPSAIGGERDILVTKTVGALDDRIRARTNPLGEMKLRHSQDDGVRGTSLVVWDGADNNQAINASGLGGVSLLADNATAFLLDITGSDIGGPIRVRVYEQGNIGNFLEGVFAVPGGILSAFPADDITMSMLFSSMLVTGSASANMILSNVGAMSLLIDGSAPAQEGWDLNVALFRTNGHPVSEPGALLGLGLGLIGIGAARRRARR